MSQTLADDIEVMFGQQEEIAGAMEMEGSSQNRRGRETWLEATEPYRGARPRMRDFDRLGGTTVRTSISENTRGSKTSAPS